MLRSLTAIINRLARTTAKRSFEAGGGSGRWPTAATMIAQPRQALAARGIMAQRAAWLVANAPIAAATANTWCTNLIGDGPSVRSGHPSRAMARALEGGWTGFYQHADVEGGDLVSALNRAVRGLVTHGEAFARLVTTDRGELRLQLLSPEAVDPSLNRELDNGNRIVAGIEIGPNGERLAFHVLPTAPDGWFPVIGPAVRVPAADICHVFEPLFPGQVRGISWLAPVATRIVELDAAEDAALMKLKTTALFAGFVRDFDGTATSDVKGIDPATLSLEPGTLRVLPPGADISFAPTADMQALGDFLKHMQRSIAAGSGTPYNLIADDLEGVNYSSARVGLQNFWRRCAAIRASVLAARLLQPVWERFVTLEILSGRIIAPDFDRDPTPYFAVNWLWPQPASLDPAKETDADIAAINAGIRSRSEVIAARGRDITDVDAEIASDSFEPAQPAQRTVVTEHDERGRIRSFDRFAVMARGR